MMPVFSDTEPSRRNKRMRKGTRSCEECRQRKVRCIFGSDTPECEGCLRRGTTCVEQGQAESPGSSEDPNRNIRQWLSRIDNSLERISSRIDLLCQDRSSAGSTGSPATLQGDLERLRLELFRSAHASPNDAMVSSGQASDVDEASAMLRIGEKAPLLGLIDNAALHARHTTDERVETTTTSASTAIETSTTKLLGTLIPRPSDFLLIVQASTCAWDVWGGVLQFPFDPQIAPNTGENITERISEMLATANSSIMVKVLLGLAICVQQLPRTFDLAQTPLPASPAALEREFVAVAEAVLAADQSIANTIDGLECMVLQSKYYVNMGKPRTAWLIGQRALSTCHVFGVHDLIRESDTPKPRWEAVWLMFWHRDRALSLLLGLPHATSLLQREPDADMVTADLAKVWMRLGSFCGQVIERNLDSSKMTFSQTLNIDQELESFKYSMPAGWWEAPPAPDMSLPEIESLYMSRFMLHHIRKMLHLPYMVKAMTDKKFDYSRDAALEASREMIKIFLLLRVPKRPLLAMCQVEDFQAFTASLVLVVNLLGNRPNMQEAERDWSLVQEMAGTFARVSTDRGCTVATQACHLLEDFLKARYNFPSEREGSYTAVVPYFGHITLTRRVAATTSLVQPSYEEQGREGDCSGISNPLSTEGPITEASLDPYNWIPVDAEWLTMGDDLDQDWSNFNW